MRPAGRRWSDSSSTGPKPSAPPASSHGARLCRLISRSGYPFPSRSNQAEPQVGVDSLGIPTRSETSRNAIGARGSAAARRLRFDESEASISEPIEDAISKAETTTATRSTQRGSRTVTRLSCGLSIEVETPKGGQPFHQDLGSGVRQTTSGASSNEPSDENCRGPLLR